MAEKKINEFVKLMDVKKDDYLKWDLMKVDIVRNENKKFNNVSYSLSFSLPYVDVKDLITSSKYNSILIALRKYENTSLKGLDVHYRIVRGKTKDGNEYYQVQMKFSDNCSFAHLLSSSDSRNLVVGSQMTNKKLVIIEKPDEIDEKFDVDDVPDFNK